jgi:hemerythrin superfamily protein
MDAITMLKEDHRNVQALFRRFERAGDRAYATKRTLVDNMIEELSKHAAIEEELFYPTTRATVPGVDDIVLESIEEHHIVKWVLSELEGMESDCLPKVRRELTRKALGELGEAMESAKKAAPTKPHPRSHPRKRVLAAGA